jgi:ribosomal-protein-alanine N-acetyltransferase
VSDERLQILSVDACQSEVLAALHGQCFAEAWAPDSIAALLAMPGSMALLAAGGSDGPEGAEPVGFLLARDTGDDWEVISIGVQPCWRRRGVARALLAAMVGRIHGAQRRAVVLEVAADNIAAQKLYEGLGFRLVGRRPRYYRRTSPAPVDALILRRSA